MDNQTLRRLTPLSQSVEVSLRKATHHALDTEGSFSRAKLAQGIALDLGMPFEKPPKCAECGVLIESCDWGCLSIC